MLLTVQFAMAASLDNPEVGGAWGSPLATDGAAVWWNPAGMAAGTGTRFVIEGAPTFATIRYDRAEPHGGEDVLTLGGTVPFGGLVTDFGVDGLGIGVSLAVPFVRGGTSTSEPPLDFFSANGVGTGAGHYALRDGMAQALYVTLAGAYEVQDRVAFGGGMSIVRSSWTALVDSETLPDLNDAILAQGEDPGYTDGNLEDPAYAAVLDFDEMGDLAFTFSAGLRVKANEQLSFALAYVHGAELQNEGTVNITFGCPPETDTVGRFGVEDLGLCYTEVPAEASVAYTLPGRLHGGVSFRPVEPVEIQAMGGWVRWSVFDDYTINIHDAQIDNADAQELVNQKRTWARANHDSFWGGLDVKGDIGRRVTLGARLTYDAAAVPDEALSPNNYDANDVILGGLAAVRVIQPLQLAVSYSHHFLATREVTNSSFGMSLGARAEDRWFYPHANGTYAGAIDRIGVSLRGMFR